MHFSESERNRIENNLARLGAHLFECVCLELEPVVGADKLKHMTASYMLGHAVDDTPNTPVWAQALAMVVSALHEGVVKEYVDLGRPEAADQALANLREAAACIVRAGQVMREDATDEWDMAANCTGALVKGVGRLVMEQGAHGLSQ